MAGAAEEAGEKVKGVVGTAAGGFVFGEAFVAVLVVYSARFWLGEGFVGGCDLDEFFVRGIIAPGRKRGKGLAIVCVCDQRAETCVGKGFGEVQVRYQRQAKEKRNSPRPDVRILVRMKLLAQSPICFFNILIRSSLV